MGHGWNSIRDALETAGTLVGNYYLPGSSLVTSHLTSHGSQDQLNSPLGQLAQLGTGGAGAGVGSGFTGIPSASSVGGGWTNAANGVGGWFGDPTAGTDLASKVSGIFGSGSGASKAGDFYKYDLNGNPVGNSALSATEQFSPANLGLSNAEQPTSGGPNFGNIMKMMGGMTGAGGSQQSNGQPAPTAPAPYRQPDNSANMQNIYAHIRNLQQQMAQPTNSAGSLANNISHVANPYFPNFQQYR